jgi:hypothetical protein
MRNVLGSRDLALGRSGLQASPLRHTGNEQLVGLNEIN